MNAQVITQALLLLRIFIGSAVASTVVRLVSSVRGALDALVELLVVFEDKKLAFSTILDWTGVH